MSIDVQSIALGTIEVLTRGIAIGLEGLRALADILLHHGGGIAGCHVVRELEPDGCVAEAVGRAPRRGVKLTLRCFRFRQTQEYENGAVQGLYFFGGQ